MLPGLDQLIQRWRADPRPAVTLALCQSLAEYGEDRRRDAASNSDEWAAYLELTSEIGSVIDKQHAAEIDVLVAAARMHLSAGAILWAQQVAIRAAKLRPGEPAAFRVLGEALLRRGDAKRAIRALERAVEGGLKDARTRVWRDRARFYSDMQDKRGLEAVRDEVRRVLGTKASQMPLSGVPGASLPPGMLSMPPPPGRLGVDVPPPSARSRARRPRLHTLLGVAPDDLDVTPMKGSLNEAENKAVEAIAGDADARRQPRRLTGEYNASSFAKGDDNDDEKASAGPARTAPASRPGRPVEPDPHAPTLTDEESTATGDVTPERPLNVKAQFLAAARGEVPAEVPQDPSFAESASSLEETVERLVDEPSEGDGDTTAVLDDEDMPTQRRDPDKSMLSELAAAARQVEPAPRSAEPPRTAVMRIAPVAKSREEQPQRPVVRDARAEPDEEIPTEVAPLDVRIQRAAQEAEVRQLAREAQSERERKDELAAPFSRASSPTQDVAVLGSDPRFGPEPGAPPPPSPARPPTAPVFGPPPASLGDTARLSNPDIGVVSRDSDADSDDSMYPRAIIPGPSVPSDAPPADGPPAEPPSVDSAEGAALPRVEVPRSSRRLWLAGAAAIGLVAAAGGLFHWRSKRQEEEARQLAASLAKQAEAQLALGSPESLESAHGLIERAWALDAKSAGAAQASVRRNVLHALDVEAGEGPALALVAQARRLDVHGPTLAAAMLASAVAMGNSALAENLVAEHDESPTTKDDPYYLLAAGAALDRQGSSAALVRYRRATELQPTSRTARIRLARALIVHGSAGEATPIVKELGDEDAPAAHVLSSLVKHQAGEDEIPPISPDEHTALTRPLRSIASALLFNPTDLDAAKLDAMCAEADVPMTAIIAGERVFRAGNAELAMKAVECALSLAPRYATAHALAVRVALARGDLASAKTRIDELPAPDAVLLRAILAYEDGDVERVISARAEAKGIELSGSTVTLLAVMAARLRGKRPLSSELLEQLTSDAPPWTPVVVIDAALDRGALDEAEKLLNMEGAAEHPILSQRVARLARLAGEYKSAKAAIENAFESRSALREKALISAERRAWRKDGLAALDERLGPYQPWLEGYLTARGPSRTKARTMLAKVELPGPDAELELRIVAGLALGEVGDRNRGERVLAPVVKAFPNRRDVVWAAIALRMLPPSAIRRFVR